jgi:hypothetical protein
MISKLSPRKQRKKYAFSTFCNSNYHNKSYPYFYTKKYSMTTMEIANRLIELCSKGEFETAQKELFADNAISIEPYASPDFEKETKGLQAIIEKGRKFELMVEAMHRLTASEPMIAGNSIAFVLTMDVTMKGKDRVTWTELCVYVVKDGKIISEQFSM